MHKCPADHYCLCDMGENCDGLECQVCVEEQWVVYDEDDEDWEAIDWEPIPRSAVVSLEPAGTSRPPKSQAMPASSGVCGDLAP